jgi:hypothetical protein
MSSLFGDLKQVYSEPEDTKVSVAFSLLIWLAVILMLWTFIIPTTPSYVSTYQSALFMLILSIVFLFATVYAGVKKMEDGIASYSTGPLWRALIGLWMAAIIFCMFTLAVGMNTQAQTSWIDALSYVPLSVLSDSTASWFFSCIIAPWVEEGFRTVIVPTLALLIAVVLEKRIRDNNIRFMAAFLIAAVVANVFFAIYHGEFTFTRLDLFFGIFVWGMIFTAGNYILKTSAFSITFHLLKNNYMYVTTYGFPMDLHWTAYLVMAAAVFGVLAISFLFFAKLSINTRRRNMLSGAY